MVPVIILHMLYMVLDHTLLLFNIILFLSPIASCSVLSFRFPILNCGFYVDHLVDGSCGYGNLLLNLGLRIQFAVM